MAAGFAGPLSGSRATDHPADIRFLTDDTAVVVSEGGIIFPGSTLSRAKGLVRATWVLVRYAGGWRTPAATTAPPARALSSRCGAFPSGAAPHLDPNSSGPITALAQP